MHSSEFGVKVKVEEWRAHARCHPILMQSDSYSVGILQQQESYSGLATYIKRSAERMRCSHPILNVVGFLQYCRHMEQWTCYIYVGRLATYVGFQQYCGDTEQQLESLLLVTYIKRTAIQSSMQSDSYNRRPTCGKDTFTVRSMAGMLGILDWTCSIKKSVCAAILSSMQQDSNSRRPWYCSRNTEQQRTCYIYQSDPQQGSL